MIRKQYFRELSRVYSMIYEAKFKYMISLVITGVATPCIQILFAFAFKNAINAVQYNNSALFGKACYLVIASIIIQCMVEPLANCYNGILVNRIICRIKEVVFNHTEKLPISYFERTHSGDIMARLTSDIEQFEPIYRGTARNLMQTVIFGISALISMLILSYELVICSLVFSSVIFFSNAAFTNILRALSQKNQEQLSKVTQAFVNVYNGAATAKIFAKQENLMSQFQRENSLLAGVAKKTANTNVKKSSLNYAISFGSRVGVLLIGLILVSRNQLDIGSVIGIVTLQTGVTNMFVSIGGFLATMQGNLAGVSRIFEILDTKAEQERYAIQAASDPEKDDMIVYENVCFSYDHENYVLNHINLSMKKNNVYALVGTNGSGKSTLMKLLLGFYEPEGRVSLLGRAFGDYSLQEIRDRITYVEQHPVLFSTSILENIRYGKLDASETEVMEAAKLAGIHEYIVSLPDGYGTFVGDNGAFLSGGQRQRIVIARALIKNAPVIILDEATSSLDTENELDIIKSLQQLADNRIVIIIGHRLSSIQNSDWIYVLDRGQIKEQGTHGQLMEKQGLYCKLYRLQLTESDTISLGYGQPLGELI
ncbi:ABC transporter ATP-binding protein [Paenibacillus tepidiphilus]|uniref:ABC transporter ATP-binding protein n=1 Tax=Paenibacillus tepidiphilus TaxID=2608683 RepID=UPI00123BEBB9|nr:ABC transporter ATP-binding protein [Paenibacillus tepidiphilus]